jgi:hypothetical protein
MSDADASNVAHDRGDEPAEAGIGRRIARIAW